MRLEKFGDSYDIVKQSLLRWLSPCGDWVAQPMFTEDVPKLQAEAFSRHLGVPLLSTQTLRRESVRDEYFASAESCGKHLFLDPNTGLKVPSARRADAPNFVNGTDLVRLAVKRPDKLTLVFDQSIDRRYPLRQQVEAKLVWLREQNVFGVTYESHACFVLVSASKSVLKSGRAMLLRQSGLPSGRLVEVGGSRRTRG
jgi:hypothetical protein